MLCPGLRWPDPRDLVTDHHQARPHGQIDNGQIDNGQIDNGQIDNGQTDSR